MSGPRGLRSGHRGVKEAEAKAGTDRVPSRLCQEAEVAKKADEFPVLTERHATRPK
ncbi:hypothetical protein MTO96_051063, partial [Rhipicephalus appendiculatus]